ncbi:MAG: MarR family winged helix-turn-helix transcriptional regulator [Acidimicrobiales bacterium]
MKPTEREELIDRLGRDAFITTFIVSNRFTEDLEQCCRAEGISHALYAALWVLCLADAPDGLPMGALADDLLTRAADTTRLVDRLIKQRLATRKSSLTDRRVVLVSATSQGRELFERLTAEIKALHRRQWAALTNDEIREVTRLLNKALWTRESAPRDVGTTSALAT